MDPDTTCKAFLDGEQFNRLKDRDRKKMSAPYLREKLATDHAWISPVYERTSDFVHLSGRHFEVSITRTDDETFVNAFPRWRCKAAGRQACGNSSITGKHLEDRVLAGLREHLLTPEIVSRFAIYFQRELDTQMPSAHGRRDEIEAGLAEARRRIAKLVKQMERDDLLRSVMTRLKDLEREEERLEQELANMPERTVVRLPANYEAVYRSAIAELDLHLAPREASPSRNAIRTLIEAVVVHGRNSRGGKHRRLELQGDLFRMLEFAEAAANSGNPVSQKRQRPQRVSAGAARVTPLVAGVGFEPTTFRL